MPKLEYIESIKNEDSKSYHKSSKEALNQKESESIDIDDESVSRVLNEAEDIMSNSESQKIKMSYESIEFENSRMK